MAEEQPTQNLLTVVEVAHHFRVDPSTVRRWIKLGSLEAISLPSAGCRTVYRVRRATLDAIDELTVSSAHQSALAVLQKDSLFAHM